VFAAETNEQAGRLFTSLQQSFVNLRRGAPGPLPPPVESMEGLWTAVEKYGVEHAFREAIVGSPSTVKRGVEAFIDRTGVDELMVTAAIFSHEARLRSFEIVAQVAIGKAGPPRHPDGVSSEGIPVPSETRPRKSGTKPDIRERLLARAPEGLGPAETPGFP